MKLPRPAPAALLALFFVLGQAAADDRKFTYSYEAKTLPQSTWEFEQWGTFEEGKASGHWGALLLREEIEYGVTDALNGSLYLNSLYQDHSRVLGAPNEHSFGFDSMSTEWKYKLTEPSTDLVGSLLYGELRFSNAENEIETKLVLSKEAGPFTLAYNFVWEAVLSRADDPAASPQWHWEHELSNTLGASLSVLPALALGVEAYDISRFDHSLSGAHSHATYAGPNLHYSSGSWWVTVTALWQVSFGRGPEFTDPDNTRYAVRLIFGVNF